MQRKQTHEADTWREMCTIPVSTGQQADDLLTARKGAGVGAGRVALSLMGHHKDGKGYGADDEDEGGDEDTDLPQGTRYRAARMTDGGVSTQAELPLQL